MLKVKFDSDQYNKLAYNSVNYACGRSSYIVGIIIRIIRDNINCLNYEITNKIAGLIIDRNFGDSSHSSDWRLLARDLLDTNNEVKESVEITFRDEDDLRLLILTSFRSNLYFPDNGIVPDYQKVLAEYSKYMYKNWYKVFLDDISDAMYYGVDLSPYNDALEFIYDTERTTSFDTQVS